jgi:hypothetical protein
MSDKPIKGVKADWNEVVLVCRKCSKKLDGGFGADGDQKLAKVLRKAIGAKGRGRGGGRQAGSRTRLRLTESAIVPFMARRLRRVTHAPFHPRRRRAPEHWSGFLQQGPDLCGAAG